VTTTTTTTLPPPTSEAPEENSQSWAEARDQAKDVLVEKAEAEAKRFEKRIKKIFG
jgi:hypothetical protein